MEVPLARFAGIEPQAVASCATAGEVSEALARARRDGLPIAVRSGGHCFAGRSSTEGLLIDVGPMSSVELEDGIATIGAGARLGDVYDALEPHGVTVAAGCGPTVGIGGLALGGGLGILGRMHGLTSDQLVGARVVLADGAVVDCDEQAHDDLFWALRGAGGGQFGVVTELRLRTVDAPEATTIDLGWRLADARAVATAWQEWAPDGPDELAASLHVRPGGVHVVGTMLGGEVATKQLLDALVARAGRDPRSADLRTLTYREAKRHLSEEAPPEPGSEPYAYSKSEFFSRSLPAEAVDALVALLREAPGDCDLDFSPWGGAYNRVRPDATAFAHRGARFLLKHGVAVAPDADPAPAREWLARSWGLAHPWGTGGVYPNFPDPDLGDALRAYHGPNLERLRQVKAAYDPDRVFDFHQAV
jgi:FAD/FMN-containing dehydrogenase